jgi:hypothetical protein
MAALGELGEQVTHPHDLNFRGDWLSRPGSGDYPRLLLLDSQPEGNLVRTDPAIADSSQEIIYVIMLKKASRLL